VAGAKPRTLCRSLFKQLEILPVPSQDVLSLMTFLISNQGNFEANSSMHNINARNNNHLHRPNASLSCFHRSTFYACIKNFNWLENPQE